jgi:hypothetical protein
MSVLSLFEIAVVLVIAIAVICTLVFLLKVAVAMVALSLIGCTLLVAMYLLLKPVAIYVAVAIAILGAVYYVGKKFLMRPATNSSA